MVRHRIQALLVGTEHHFNEQKGEERLQMLARAVHIAKEEVLCACAAQSRGARTGF